MNKLVKVMAAVVLANVAVSLVAPGAALASAGSIPEPRLEVVAGAVMPGRVVNFAQYKGTLSCTTPGDALGSVVIAKGKLTIYELDERESLFRLRQVPGFGDAVVLSGESAESESFGGGMSRSVMFVAPVKTLTEGGKAYLANRGNTYELDCKVQK